MYWQNLLKTLNDLARCYGPFLMEPGRGNLAKNLYTFIATGCERGEDEWEREGGGERGRGDKKERGKKKKRL